MSKLLDGYLGSDLPQIFKDFFVKKIRAINPNKYYDEADSAASDLKKNCSSN